MRTSSIILFTVVVAIYAVHAKASIIPLGLGLGPSVVVSPGLGIVPGLVPGLVHPAVNQGDVNAAVINAAVAANDATQQVVDQVNAVNQAVANANQEAANQVVEAVNNQVVAAAQTAHAQVQGIIASAGH